MGLKPKLKPVLSTRLETCGIWLRDEENNAVFVKVEEILSGVLMPLIPKPRLFVPMRSNAPFDVGNAEGVTVKDHAEDARSNNIVTRRGFNVDA